MVEKLPSETGDNNTVSSVQNSITGALKSVNNSQRAEKAKRASAVRFADQVNLTDEMEKMSESKHSVEVPAPGGDEAILGQIHEGLNLLGAKVAAEGKQPVAKVKGR